MDYGRRAVTLTSQRWVDSLTVREDGGGEQVTLTGPWGAATVPCARVDYSEDEKLALTEEVRYKLHVSAADVPAIPQGQWTELEWSRVGVTYNGRRVNILDVAAKGSPVSTWVLHVG